MTLWQIVLLCLGCLWTGGLLGFLTASIMASGKVAELLDEIDTLQSNRRDTWLENPTWGEP